MRSLINVGIFLNLFEYRIRWLAKAGTLNFTDLLIELIRMRRGSCIYKSFYINCKGMKQMNILMGILLSLFIFVTGVLFMKFNSTFWNNPLLLIFKNRNDVNQITGKSFIAMSLLYFIIAILYHPTISSMVVLYLVLALIDFIVVGLVIHSKNRKNIKVQ